MHNQDKNGTRINTAILAQITCFNLIVIASIYFIFYHFPFAQILIFGTFVFATIKGHRQINTYYENRWVVQKHLKLEKVVTMVRQMSCTAC
jgi:uncharacterized membrane protein YdbT with pleckstrin-like domain